MGSARKTWQASEPSVCPSVGGRKATWTAGDKENSCAGAWGRAFMLLLLGRLLSSLKGGENGAHKGAVTGPRAGHPAGHPAGTAPQASAPRSRVQDHKSAFHLLHGSGAQEAVSVPGALGISLSGPLFPSL